MFRATCRCGRELQINHPPPERYRCGTVALDLEGKPTGKITGGCGYATTMLDFVDDLAPREAVTDA